MYDKAVRSREKLSAAVAVLVKFDVSDLSTPLQVCRDELSTRPMARFELHPRRLEEVVSSVYSDMGYETELTAYSKDGGIDVFLRSPTGALSAVQVKRYKDSIGAELIRSFVGALVLRDVPRGVYVTTSQFTTGAANEAAAADSLGIPIELVDCDRLFSYLQIAQKRRRELLTMADVGLDPAQVTTRFVWAMNSKG